MNYYEPFDIREAIIEAIESEFNQEVERIAKIKDFGGFFRITVIFENYDMFEGKITITEFCELASLKIEGTYY